jgi:hypothetical protein
MEHEVQRWAIARVRSGCELLFQDWATRREVPIYLPVARRSVIRGRRPVRLLVERPLFTGYAFTVECRSAVLRETSAFLKLLRNGDGELLRVSAAVVTELRARIASGEFDDVGPPSTPRFVIGSPATISAGPLMGFRGVVLGVLGRSLLLDVNARLVRCAMREVEVGHLSRQMPFAAGAVEA